MEGGGGGAGSHGFETQPFLLVGVPLVYSSWPLLEEDFQGP